MRVEAELAGGTVDDATREDPVERRLSGERPVQQRSVLRRLVRRNEWFGPASRAQHGGVDARRRSEAGPRHTPDEPQLVPRSPGAAEQGRGPDGCPFRGQPPLHDRIELRQRDTRVTQQAAQDRGARCEGEVRYDRERLPRERYQRRIGLHDVDEWIAVETRPQPAQGSRVQLDGADASAGIGERAREDAPAGAEIEREHAGRDARVPDQLVGEGATTKGVTAAGPRLR